MSSEHTEIPQGLNGLESQCLPMQERCGLHLRGRCNALDLDSAHLHLAVWQVITIRRARLGWCVTPSIAPFPYALHWFYKRRLMLGFAGVCEMYEGHKHLCRLRRRRPHALCLPCVESAMCSRAGPVGVSCPGRLSPAFRDSGSASPSCALLTPRSGRLLI